MSCDRGEPERAAPILAPARLSDWRQPLTVVTFALVCLAVVALAACRRDGQVSQLPALGTLTNETSVSGISSGAYMAGQFQLAHGEIVVGAGLVAGGPYGCAESIYADVMPGPATAILNATKAINGCMLNAMQFFGVPNPPMLARKARGLAEAGAIAPTASIVTDRVYLFTGRADRTVMPAIVKAAADFYVELGVPPPQIKFVSTLGAGHAFVTENTGNACDFTGKPYVVDCDYDQAGDLLSFIYGPLQPPSSRAQGTLELFDQRQFTSDLAHHGLADTGAIYIPAACTGASARSGGNCRVHVAFHGCGQNRELAGDAFIRGSGYARWADTNRLVVLFPQTTTEAFNPQACWDWWGYTGRDYLTRHAPQIIAIRRMLQRLSAPNVSS